MAPGQARKPKPAQTKVLTATPLNLMVRGQAQSHEAKGRQVIGWKIYRPRDCAFPLNLMAWESHGGAALEPAINFNCLGPTLVPS